jgi:NCK adaptor protein
LTLCETFTAVVRYAYEAQKPDELSLCRGDSVVVREKSSDGWWNGRSVTTGLRGWFPSNYVEVRPCDSAIRHTVSPTLDDSCQCRHIPASLRHAVALFKFDASNDDELSFNENERLDILDDSVPADAGWLRARNVHGDVGLIPQEFVRVSSAGDSDSPPSGAAANSASGGSLSNSSAGQGSLGAERSSSGISLSGMSRNGSVPFAGRDWYFGNITRAECEDLLNKFADDGDFLIRESETNVGDYTLTMKTPHRNKHFRIIADCAGTYRIGPQLFHSLDDLVEHYTKHAIYRLGSEKLFLVKPFVRNRQDRDSTDVVGSFSGKNVSCTQRDNMYDM